MCQSTLQWTEGKYPFQQSLKHSHKWHKRRLSISVQGQLGKMDISN